MKLHQFDPPGEDHRETAAYLRSVHEAEAREEQIREQANDLVAEARLSHRTDTDVLRYLAENHDDQDVWCAAMEMVLEDVRTMARGKGVAA